MNNETNETQVEDLATQLDKAVEEADAEFDADEAKNQADAAYFKPGNDLPTKAQLENLADAADKGVVWAMRVLKKHADLAGLDEQDIADAESWEVVARAIADEHYRRSLVTDSTEAEGCSDPIEGEPSVGSATVGEVITPSTNVHVLDSYSGENIINAVSTPTAAPLTGLAARLAAQMNKPLVTVAVKGGKTPTAEQQAILVKVAEVVKAGGDVAIMIEAGAGTGKTTTFRMLADVLPGNGQYTAFNRALVNESSAKFHGTHVDCKTTHQLAFRAVGYKFADRLNGPRVRSEQVARMLGIKMLSIRRTTVDEATGEHSTKPHNLAPGFLAGQVMGALRRFSQSADKEVSPNHFKYIDGLDLPSEDGRRTYTCNNQIREYLLPFAARAWQDLNNPEGGLPFTHDYYVKMWELDNPVISADYILLDEAQDTAEVMLSILRQQKIPKILVGDSAQAIYEWRGAINAMQAFPGADRLFLSQSFRFGPAIADVANAVLETLEDATPLRLKGFDKINSVVAPMTEYKAVLCRTNAVAVGRLLSAIADGKAPFLVGGGADVIAFVKAAKELQQGLPTSHPELACFESWPGVQAYVKEDEGEDLKLLVNLIDAFGCDPIISALENMPAEKDADLIISTGHRSKGREWDSVKIERDFPTLSKSDDASKKLLYVAVTRARLALDISECPFFTGQDAVDLSDIIRPADYTPVMVPTPSRPITTEFTWSKDKNTGNWVIRGPSDADNTTVEVTRKDGSKSTVRLGRASYNGDGFSLYPKR